MPSKFNSDIEAIRPVPAPTPPPLTSSPIHPPNRSLKLLHLPRLDPVKEEEDYYYNDDNELVDYKCVIGGDNEYFNIACASVLAKETHDKIIHEYVNQQPELDEKYHWSSNVCYGTLNHREGIEKWGLSKRQTLLNYLNLL